MSSIATVPTSTISSTAISRPFSAARASSVGVAAIGSELMGSSRGAVGVRMGE